MKLALRDSRKEGAIGNLLDTLSIRGYRGFSSLDLRGCGRVNLITGANNSGKSTVLEAIRLLVSGGSPSVFRDILDYREESVLTGDPDREVIATQSLLPLSTLFFGCPNLAKESRHFEISSSGAISASQKGIACRIGWCARRSDEEGQTVSYEPLLGDLFDDFERLMAVEISTGSRRRVLPLARLGRRPYGRPEIVTNAVPCVYLALLKSEWVMRHGD